MKPPPSPDADRKTVRLGELQFITVDGRPPEENFPGSKKPKRNRSRATSRVRSRSSSLRRAGARSSKVAVGVGEAVQSKSRTSQMQAVPNFHHKILIAVHPRIRYTLIINRIRVFDSDIDARRRRAHATDQNEEGFLVHSHTPTHVSPVGEAKESNKGRKRLDEPGPLWTSAALRDGDDIFCWWSSNGDGSNAGDQCLKVAKKGKTIHKLPCY